MRSWSTGMLHRQRRSRRSVRAAALAAERPITTMVEPPTDAVESVFRQFQCLDAKQRKLLWQRIWSKKTETADITIDEVILNALEFGRPVTINEVTKCFRDRVRMRLERLRVRGIVVREGRGGAHREFTYRLVRPDRVAKAIRETGGGLARAVKREESGNSQAPSQI
jgi:hypothetical protein